MFFGVFSLIFMIIENKASKNRSVEMVYLITLKFDISFFELPNTSLHRAATNSMCY
jgi:hypothetical protein